MWSYEVGSKFVRSWLEVRTKLARSSFEVGPKFVRSWLEVRSKLGRSSFEVETKFVRSWAEKIVRKLTPSHQEGKVLCGIDLASV